MSQIKIIDILNWLDDFCPFDTAEDWDNCGLLVGGADMAVSKVLVTLDVTHGVIDQARHLGANLIICHHPPIFNAVKALPSGGIPYLLAKNDIACIAVHTNLDKAHGGVGDMLAKQLGLADVMAVCGDIMRVGTLEKEMSCDEFLLHVKDSLGIGNHGTSFAKSPHKHTVRRVAVCSGSGADYISFAENYHDKNGGIDAYVTGEIGYHYWLPSNIMLVSAGHYHTEIIMARRLCEMLSDSFHDIGFAVANQPCPYDII